MSNFVLKFNELLLRIEPIVLNQIQKENETVYTKRNKGFFTEANAG